MSIGNNLPDDTGSIVNRSETQSGSGVTKKESEAFLKELEKVVESRNSLVEGEDTGTGSKVTHADRPPTTVESEKVKEKDSLKRRFLKAILKGDFQKAYQEISDKVESRDFVQWLNRVIPDAKVSDIEESVSVGSDNTQGVNRNYERLLSKLDEGAKILGALNKMVVDKKLYEAGILVNQIDSLVADLNEGELKVEEFQDLLNELKLEFSKKPISQESILKILENHKNVVDLVYPAFTQLSSADTFKTQFETLTSGFCEVIQDHLDTEGLFRISGNIGPESIIVSRLLDGDPPEEVFEEFNNVYDYCDGLMHLCDQFIDLKDRGVLSEGDINKMEGSIKKIHDLLVKVEENPNNKMTTENIAIVAGKLTRVLDLLDLNNWKKEGETEDQTMERLMKALQAENTPPVQSNKKNKRGALARVKQLFNIS